jgi:hypothetical protein
MGGSKPAPIIRRTDALRPLGGLFDQGCLWAHSASPTPQGTVGRQQDADIVCAEKLRSNFAARQWPSDGKPKGFLLSFP